MGVIVLIPGPLDAVIWSCFHRNQGVINSGHFSASVDQMEPFSTLQASFQMSPAMYYVSQGLQAVNNTFPALGSNE